MEVKSRYDVLCKVKSRLSRVCKSPACHSESQSRKVRQAQSDSKSKNNNSKQPLVMQPSGASGSFEKEKL
ncbi:uncharacterized protein FOMMEDRAFT_150718 [Fomitiporia mediterranea MF3/22]|uniref:uncharacterized protein n=1 Tax=Fomitiporia mediterranea (strain MF3/22) TaxID=694068 RepID=UPI00044097CB|nr:uncharacterized protein FOMMEDRAFT_150718 [Fomitiporia mediterranea MF3/22]EJD08049.1 hypothetical protein FOMMEDRAFT_150718 [Fomitiporia mediterranea MF3/22]